MYILEGNIGAGKSTFLRLLEKQVNYLTVVFEPTHQWNNEGIGKSLLSHFYQDPQRWAFALETLTLLSRIKEYAKEQQKNNQFTVMERSIYSGYYCFAKNGFMHGFLSELEWNIHNQCFEFFSADSCYLPHGFIYLRTSPTIAYERVKKRNRCAEQEISFDYLSQISERHDELLLHKKDLAPHLHDVPVLVLDVNDEFEKNTQQLHGLIQQVEQFIVHTSSLRKTPSQQHPSPNS